MNVPSRPAGHHPDDVAPRCKDGVAPLGADTADVTKAIRDQLTDRKRCIDMPDVPHRPWPVNPTGEP